MSSSNVAVESVVAFLVTNKRNDDDRQKDLIGMKNSHAYFPAGVLDRKFYSIQALKLLKNCYNQ